MDAKKSFFVMISLRKFISRILLVLIIPLTLVGFVVPSMVLSKLLVLGLSDLAVLF